jgi:caffeoyl-CoA O-methyltransferase
MKALPWHRRRHRRETLKYTALDDGLYRYLVQCRSGGEDALLEALRAETRAKFREDAPMQIPRDQGAFMTLLAAAAGARRAVEVGTFTGISAIYIARGLPQDGRLLCLDISREWTDLARKYWARAGVAEKIELRLGPALESLARLERGRRFDFAFIDAAKPEYDGYYELLLPRMRKNGLMLFDNMLWGGRLGKKSPPKHPAGRALDALNRKLARDPRVESVLLPIGDGVNLCRVLGG